VGVYFDPLSAMMLVLVSFIGFTIARYTMRYLDGDPRRGRFMRWIAFTLGAVQLLIVAGNLLLFTAAWLLTSFGLHQLLTHYGDRPGAIAAAHKKFVISRLGDLLLVGALILTYREFGTFDYSDIFAAAAAMPVTVPWTVQVIGMLFVLGAMTKSAQFPWYSWLPDTMETPTPVSALMHAGIINAGGFLVIRLSPLVSLSHLALDLLAAVGALTALYAAVIMLTQTSIKRQLAYSTIAQMGFMMLQCGVGAFPAAFMHLIGHSLYKAHAFLNAGSIIGGGKESSPSGRAAESSFAWLALWAAILTAAGICFGLSVITNATPGSKPGALLLGLILTLALAQLLWNSFRTRKPAAIRSGLAVAGMIGAIYYVGYALFAWLLIDCLPSGRLATSALDYVIMGVTVAGFGGLFLLPTAIGRWNSGWGEAMYVHALNGFYVDVTMRRVFARCTLQRGFQLQLSQTMQGEGR
jgi:NAD(P)H-quinone oxidoreductase subunit 5